MRDFKASGSEAATGRASRPVIAYAAQVGLDVHKDSISVALAPSGREPPRHLGEIANQPAAVGKLARRLAARHGGELVQFCYEAGPCGYDLHRQLTGLGFDCAVLAPSRMQKAPGERCQDGPARLAAAVDGVLGPGAEREQLRVAAAPGRITRTGNGHERRALVESAWSYRFPARRTAHLERKAAGASKEAKEIDWKAQRRLCARYQHLLRSGKNSKHANVAVARELAGFIWDIVRREMAQVPVARHPAAGWAGRVGPRQDRAGVENPCPGCQRHRRRDPDAGAAFRDPCPWKKASFATK